MTASHRNVLAIALFALGSATALGAEPRFLSFPEELRRARAAIGQEAECRVLIEDAYARCELRTAGAHAIQIQFVDLANGMLPRKSVILNRGTIEPAQFVGMLAAYGLPTEVTARCMTTDVNRPPAGAGYEAYVGDFNVICDRDLVTITYARAF